jgi:AraC family transcriptional regulator
MPSVSVTTTFHSPHSRLDVQRRAVPYLSIVLQGSYREHVASTVVECLPMEMRLHPAGEEHAHIIGSLGVRCMLVDLGIEWNESVHNIVRAVRSPLLVRVPGFVPLRIMTNRATAANFYHDAMLESCAAHLLDLCERQARVQYGADRSRGVRRVVASIDERLDQHLTLTGLAMEAGLHPTHLARSFRSLTGYTVGEYIRQRRVSRAQQLFITNPSYTVSRVAMESGFFDHAHLTRSFGRLLGVSPSEYRRSLARYLFASAPA